MAGEPTKTSRLIARPALRTERVPQLARYSKTMRRGAILLQILVVLMMASAVPSLAEVELSPFVGFQFGGGFDTREGDLTIDPSANLGLVLSLRTRHDGLVELLYSRQATTLEFTGIIDSGDLFDITVEYLHFGGVWEIQTDRKRPFLGLTVGGTRLDPQTSGIDDEWAFSAGISGGLKYFFSERIGLRVEGRGLLSFFNANGVIFCGYPPGQCGISVSGSNFAQLNVLAGLIIQF